MLTRWIRKLLARSNVTHRSAYALSSENGITVVKPIRTPSVDETLQLIRHIFENESYERRMYDFGGLPFPFSMEDLREFAALGSQLAQKPNRLAVVVRDDVGFGSTRAFGVYRDGDDLTETRVFHNRDEATRWLLSSDA